jgi:hypothetical protein
MHPEREKRVRIRRTRWTKAGLVGAGMAGALGTAAAIGVARAQDATATDDQGTQPPATRGSQASHTNRTGHRQPTTAQHAYSRTNTQPMPSQPSPSPATTPTHATSSGS